MYIVLFFVFLDFFMTKCLTVIVLNVILFIDYTHKILMAYDGEES